MQISIPCQLVRGIVFVIINPWCLAEDNQGDTAERALALDPDFVQSDKISAQVVGIATFIAASWSEAATLPITSASGYPVEVCHTAQGVASGKAPVMPPLVLLNCWTELQERPSWVA